MSLQATGALCLIKNYWGKVNEKIGIIYYEGNEIPVAQDNGKILLEKKKLRSCAEKIYINRFSFVCIVLGYGMGVFGNLKNDINRVLVLSTISVICVVLSVIGRVISNKVAKYAYKNDVEVNIECIEEIASVQWSNKEQLEAIDEMFSKE